MRLTFDHWMLGFYWGSRMVGIKLCRSWDGQWTHDGEPRPWWTHDVEDRFSAIKPRLGELSRTRRTELHMIYLPYFCLFYAINQLDEVIVP